MEVFLAITVWVSAFQLLVTYVTTKKSKNLTHLSSSPAVIGTRAHFALCVTSTHSALMDEVVDARVVASLMLDAGT